MKKERNGFLLFSLYIILLSLFFTGCNNQFELQEKNLVPPEGYGTIRLYFAGDAWQQRTVLPAIDVFDRFEYFFTKQPNGTPEEKTPVNGFFALELGTWTVLVKAYIGNKHVASGTTEQAITVSSSRTVELPIALTSTNDALYGNGTIKYNITYPTGSTITTFQLNNLLSPFNTIDLKPTVMPAGNTLEQIRTNIPAGYYLLTILLSHNGIIAGKNEVVHIYDSMTSTYTVEFEEVDFIGVINVPGATLAAKLTWLQTNAISNKEYIIEVNADESINPATLSYSGKNNITITLQGISIPRTISLLSNGSMFTVGYGVTLILEHNIILQGLNTNTDSLVRVNGYGTLLLNEGAKIIGNTNNGNRVNAGGVLNDGTLIMNGGEISNNTSNGTYSVNSASHGYGGGIYSSGIFIMNAGKINSNIARGDYSGGGGVYSSGTFTMNGGEINSNNLYGQGNGGGIRGYGIFTMNGGEINNNTVRHGLGGGVYLLQSIFSKTGGIITGYNFDTENGNVVKNDDSYVVPDRGHAIYVERDFVIKRRETTAGTALNLSWDGTTSSPTWSGDWEF